MPRQRTRAAPTPARSAPSRPTVPPAAAPRSQARPSSTAAAPAAQAPPAAASAPAATQSQGPGLMGQMASTAAGVAVGSSIGHVVGNWFTGGSSAAPPEQAAPAAAQPMDNNLYNSSAGSGFENPACENDVKAFRNCMNEHQGNMSICGWYMDQLKACQQAAKPY